MSIWEEQDIQGRINAILADVHFHQPDHPFGRPYLTAYQLAIALKQRFPEAAAAIGQPVGGAGIGQRSSLAQYLARELSLRIRRGSIDDIEGAFLSNQCLADVLFEDHDQIIRSSLTETQWDLSMYRLRG